ncbi:protein kinase [Aggregatilineales bacterium SYSU G02658]
MSLDLIGKQLGDYVIERQIAIGGMATIYLGRDVKLGRHAAIKVLLPDIAGQDDTLTLRFEREARAIAQLEHDNIIPIYQFGQQDNLYFLAMRYVEGDDLSSVLANYQQQNQLMPLERALKILEQVAAALDHAHAKGIVHRDVKPSNVLLAANDRVYLSDFGLVLYSTGDQTLGTAFGTPRYISPEQATDSTMATPKSDIYSLAVIVYEIVTGQRLFRGNTPMEIAISHIRDVPQPPRVHNPKISPQMQQVILRGLEKDPNARPATASLFISELRAAYQSQQVNGLDSRGSDEDEPLNVEDTRQLNVPNTPVPSGPRPVPAPISQTVMPAIAEAPPAFTRSITRKMPTLPRKPNRRPLLLTVLIGALILGGFGLLALSLLNALDVPLTLSPDPTLIVLVSEPSPEATEDAAPPLEPSETPEPTATTAPSATLEPSLTPEPSATPENTAESTDDGLLPPAQFSVTPSATATNTPRPTRTPTATVTATNTPRPTRTPTSTVTATNTPRPTRTPTATATATNTPRPTRTPTATVTATNTPRPTRTPTATVTATNTPRPTRTPTTAPSPIVTLTEPLQLRYALDVLALINLGERAQDIRGLTFTGLSESDRFVNSSTTLGDFLPGRTCVLIFLSGRSATLPPEWPCSAASRSIVLNPERVFWRADSPDDQAFTVSLNALITTCQTVGRAVGRLDEQTCRVE